MLHSLEKFYTLKEKKKKKKRREERKEKQKMQHILVTKLNWLLLTEINY